MTDRDKITEAFEEEKALNWLDDPYVVGFNDGIDRGKVIAMDLLKEQEPVKAEYLNGAWWCTNCGNVISRVVDWSRRYCCHCGREVKWDA